MTNLSLGFDDKVPNIKRKILQNIITDRRSKYSVVAGYVTTKQEVKDFMKDLLRDKYFQKSTHNSYGFRIKLENGSILEGKNDDGETGAGNCILREIQRDERINTIVVVTRYFGGIHLQADRFKNVIQASALILKEI